MYMYMDKYVWMYVSVSVCTLAYILKLQNMYIRTHTYTLPHHMSVSLRVHIHIHICIQKYPCVSVYIHTYTHTAEYTDTYTYPLTTQWHVCIFECRDSRAIGRKVGATTQTQASPKAPKCATQSRASPSRRRRNASYATSWTAFKSRPQTALAPTNPFRILRACLLFASVNGCRSRAITRLASVLINRWVDDVAYACIHVYTRTRMNTHTHAHTHKYTHTHTCTHAHTHTIEKKKGLECDMGWLRLVGSFKSYFSFAEYSLFYRALLQKRPII